MGSRKGLSQFQESDRRENSELKAIQCYDYENKMKKIMEMTRFSSGILLLGILGLVCGREVKINKCCRIGDSLKNDKQCVVGGGSAKWAPRVYMPMKQTFYNVSGELPRFMKADEEVFPRSCKDPEYFGGPNKFIVMSNGSLFVTEKNVIVSPEHYCVEKDSALVCFEDVLGDPEQLVEATKAVKVKKCCGPKQAYKEKSNIPCVDLSQNDPLYHKKFIEEYRVDLSYAFPECSSNEFAIAGPFHQSNFDPETGNLKSNTGKTFSSLQYCLDYILGEERVLQMFTCSEHFAKATPVQPPHDQRFAIYSIGLFISVVFLLATLAISILVLSNNMILHWRCQTNYIACLLVGDLLLGITQISGNSITGGACVTIGE